MHAFAVRHGAVRVGMAMRVAMHMVVGVVMIVRVIMIMRMFVRVMVAAVRVGAGRFTVGRVGTAADYTHGSTPCRR